MPKPLLLTENGNYPFFIFEIVCIAFKQINPQLIHTFFMKGVSATKF